MVVLLVSVEGLSGGIFQLGMTCFWFLRDVLATGNS
jgi:hypothetical protein